MFTVVYLIISLLIQDCGLCSGKTHGRSPPLAISESGDIIIHGISSISQIKSNSKGGVLDMREVIRTGAMVYRILEINRAGVLPGNLTLGCRLSSSPCDATGGLRRSLQTVNEMVNSENRSEYHVPVMLNAACDAVEYNSYKLFDMFRLPRISYTATSNRLSLGGQLRTVPSDLIHIEALVRVLEDMNARQVTVVTSRANPWLQRANVLKKVLEHRRRTLINTVIYFDKVNNVNQQPRIFKGSQIIVIFAEENEAGILMRKDYRNCVRVVVNKHDDPLFRIYDRNGRLSNKTIVRNIRENSFEAFKKYLARISRLEKSWLTPFIDIFKSECRNQSEVEHNCNRKIVEKYISNYFTAIQKGYRSSLSLQGAIDAVDIVLEVIRSVLVNCEQKTVKCLRSSLAEIDWTRFLKKAKMKRGGKLLSFMENGILRGNYSIQVLRRSLKSVFGRRMMVPKDWTYIKVREWNVSEDLRLVFIGDDASVMFSPRTTSGTTGLNVEITDKHRLSWHANNITTIKNNTTCQTLVSVVEWSNNWMVGLYLIMTVVLCGIIFTLIYFIKHKDSPIMILCCSWPDNISLVVLCIITVLPMMHIGVLSSMRCLLLWPAVNIIFGMYTSLLLTKTLWAQNLLKCDVATDRPVRRMIFVLVITSVHLLIAIMSSVFSSIVDTRTACIPRGRVVVCNIEDSAGIIFAMVFNCLLMSLLVLLSVQETLKQRKNFCRTEKLFGVATVAMVTYTSTLFISYFNLVLKHYLVITLLECILYLINPIVCLMFIYVPILRLVSTWLRQHTRQQKNLTSIKRAQVMSAKRQSAGPIIDTVFNTNISPHQSLLPFRQSGYYFDFRAGPGSSYPNSLVRNNHDASHTFHYGRNSGNDSSAFQRETSMEDLDAMSSAQSYESFYDNVAHRSPTRVMTLRDHLSPGNNIFKEICRQSDDDVFINEQCEGLDSISPAQTAQWPSLEKLKASNI